MIVYYQKSTKQILTIMNDSCKKHLKDEQLEEELNLMFPDMKDDVGVNRFEEENKVKILCGGTWAPKTKNMTAPPKVNKQSNPNKDRLKALKNKFKKQNATLAEIQEYLSKKG